MRLSPELIAKRDELADKHFEAKECTCSEPELGDCVFHEIRYDYNSAWSDAFNYLASRGDEFDEQAATDYYINHHKANVTILGSHVDMSRWQHEQSKLKYEAKLEQSKLIEKSAIELAAEFDDRIGELQDKVLKLEEEKKDLRWFVDRVNSFVIPGVLDTEDSVEILIRNQQAIIEKLKEQRLELLKDLYERWAFNNNISFEHMKKEEAIHLNRLNKELAEIEQGDK